MTRFNKIEEEFIAKGLAIMRPNNLWFVLSKTHSIEFVEACKRESVPILGIDGFLISGENIQSNLEDILDFTSSSYKGSDNYYEASIEFIRTRVDDMYFEIVCGD